MYVNKEVELILENNLFKFNSRLVISMWRDLRIIGNKDKCNLENEDMKSIVLLKMSEITNIAIEILI